MAMVHGWTSSLISKIWRTVRSGKGKEAKDSKKIYVRKISTQHEEKFFQLSFKGMTRFDLNMEHDSKFGIWQVCFDRLYLFNFVFLQKIC